MNPLPGPEAIQPGTPERAARWQELSENIPVGIDVLGCQPDLSAAFLFSSRAWLAMVDLKLDDLQANPELVLAAVHPDDREDLRQHNVEALSAGTLFLRHGRLLESALLFLHGILREAGITVDCRASESPLWVAGDGAQLQIVVAKLLRNAQEALLAAENGSGLPPDLLAGIAQTGGQARGMGVGLNVVETTMENHGGGLRLGRSPLGGAALTLRCPALPTPSASPAPG
ncbi:MAG: hypothetical protein ACKOCI_10920 [Cyanobium sp.]